MPIFQATGRLLLVILLGGLLAQALIVFAPGYTVDERELDPGLSQETRQALQQEKLKDRQLFASYGRFLTGILQDRKSVV